MNKQIKVFYYSSGLKQDPLLMLWALVEKELKKKGYKFIMYHEKETPNWQKIIDQIEQGYYDIAISSFYITLERYEKVAFTYPVTMVKPNIFYNANINKKNYIGFFLKTSLPLILLLIITALIFTYILFFDDHRRFKNKLYCTLAAFLGQSGGIQVETNFNKNSNIILNCIVIIVIYFFTVIIYSLIVGKTVHYKEYTPSLMNLKDKKIVINEGSGRIKLLKSLGAIPIYYSKKEHSKYKNVFDFYLANFNLYDGIYNDGWGLLNNELSDNDTVTIKANGKKYTLRQELPEFIDLGYEYIGFPMNKKKKKFIYDLNQIFLPILVGNIKNICDSSVKNNKITTC